MTIIGNLDKQEKVLHYVPTTRCNYRCEYCTEDKTFHDDRYLETAKVIRDVVVPTYRPDKIEILGGEISILNPELCKIISEIDTNYYNYFHFITNGSNLDWFLPIKDKRHKITLSIHESQREIDDIKKDIEKYRDLGLSIYPSMVLTTYNVEKIKYAKKVIPMNIYIQPEHSTKIEDLEEVYLSSSLQTKESHGNFVGKPCECKTNLLHISPRGELRRCFMKMPSLIEGHISDCKNLKEIILSNINNNLLCDSACYPCSESIIQYFKS